MRAGEKGGRCRPKLLASPTGRPGALGIAHETRPCPRRCESVAQDYYSRRDPGRAITRPKRIPEAIDQLRGINNAILEDIRSQLRAHVAQANRIFREQVGPRGEGGPLTLTNGVAGSLANAPAFFGGEGMGARALGRCSFLPACRRAVPSWPTGCGADAAAAAAAHGCPESPTRPRGHLL